MKFIISLCILLTVAALFPIILINNNIKSLQTQLDVLHERVEYSNAFRYHDKTYFVYGLEGTGYVRGKYPVYTPVYMGEFDMLNAANDQWKEQLQKLDEENVI